ncbi:MAG: hypothetical protein H5T82_10075 [Demequina sp.]|nr:hypothetical protein [Demequina sp.]
MDGDIEAPDGRAGSREPAASDDAVRFEELWESHAHRISAYATRHVGPADAHEGAPATGDDKVAPITRTSRRRRLSMRIGAAAAVAAAGIVGATLWPDSNASWIPAAYASWRAVPDPVTPGDAEAQAKACLARMRLGDPDGEVADALRFDDLVPVVAERRGDWTYTLLTAETGGEHADIECLLPLDPNSHETGDAGGSGGGIAPTPASNQIQWFGGGWSDNSADTWGYAGEDVARVTVTLANGVVVDATVSNGYFAAWWPSLPLIHDHDQAPYTLTWYLDDGTVGGTYDWTASSKVPQAG